MKSQFVAASFAVLTSLPAFSQVNAAPSTPPASAPAAESSNEVLGKQNALCLAILAISANKLPKQFPPEKVDGPMIKLADNGKKILGLDKFYELNGGYVSGIALPLGMLQASDLAEHNRLVLGYAQMANKCIGNLAIGALSPKP